MLEFLAQVERWQEQGRKVAMATVIDTWGSSPRPVGSRMVIASDQEIAGSVSGGCVESAVVEAGFQVLEEGVSRKVHFGVADETAWEVGLACGGEIDVLIHPVAPSSVEAWGEVAEGQNPYCSLLVTDGPEDLVGKEWILPERGELMGEPLDQELMEALVRAAKNRLREQTSGVEDIPHPGHDAGRLQAFLQVHLPRPAMVAVGGVHIAIPLMSIARALNYRTVVVDPRRLFASQERFPEVDVLLQSWPDQAFDEYVIDRFTAVAMLTHDPKIDDPALRIALHSDAFYVGALGSRKTQADRRRRLQESGMSEALIDTLHAPIGLDLGGGEPEEIALAVMAEVVQEYHR